MTRYDLDSRTASAGPMLDADSCFVSPWAPPYGLNIDRTVRSDLSRMDSDSDSPCGHRVPVQVHPQRDGWIGE